MITIRRSALAIGTLLGAVLWAGCGGSDPAAETTSPPPVPTTPAPPPQRTVSVPATPTPPLPGIPAADAALIDGYRDWTALTKPPIPELATLGSAHQGARRVWVDLPAADIALPYPQGTIVVKEGRSGDTVDLIAIMQKLRANDATTGGWRYVEYTRDGSGDFARVGLPESGCAGCHLNANTRQKTDWVFFSLE